MKRRGFTLIELLTVLGILMILLGLTVVGFRYVGHQGMDRATRVTLENAAAMLAELETVKKSAVPQNLTALTVPPPTPAPNGNVADPPSRYAQAVVETQRAMRMLQAVPANRKVISQFPADQVMTVLHGAPGVRYLPGDVIADSSGRLYVCTNATTSPPPGGDWSTTMPMSNSPVVADVPILLDGWRNPIIYVTSQGLQVPDPTSTAYPPATFVDPATGAPVPLVRSSDGRPFFASAGSDGVFGVEGGQNKSLDNIYSFSR